MKYNDFFSPDDYLEEFKDFLSTVEYSPRNPLNTEMFFLWCMIRTLKPSLFIESGTFRGYSAAFICAALSRNDNGAEFITIGFDLDDCIAFARRRLKNYPFATVIEADSREYVANLPGEDRPAAFFIDGPKGRNMPPLFAAIQKRFSNILFIAVHDSERESGSRNRQRVKEYFGPEFPIIFCDETFEVPYQQMDECLIDESDSNLWKPYFLHGSKRNSYGTETAYILTQHPYKLPWILRILLKPYRYLILTYFSMRQKLIDPIR